MANSTSLFAIFGAQDKMSAKMAKMGNSIDKNIGGALKRVAGLAVSAVGAVKVFDFAKDSTKAFVDFEKGMGEVYTLLPGISATAKEKMVGDVKDMAKEMGILPENVVPAIYDAISSGVPADNVFSFMETAQKASVGGVANLADTVGVLTTVVNNYGAANISAEKASDLLFQAVKYGVTTMPELATQIGDVLPSAAAMNVSFEQVAAGMATLTATMGKGSTPKAVTSLRAMFDELGNSSTKTSKTFNKMSGKTFAEFMASGGNITDALGFMQKAADKNGVAIADMFQSIEAKKAVNIFSNNAEVMNSNLAAMANAAGSTAEAYATMEETAARKIDKLKAAWAVMKLEVGGKLAEAILPAVQAITDNFDSIQGPITEFFGLVAGGIKALVPYIPGLLNGFAKLGQVLFPVLYKVGKLFVDKVLPPLAKIFGVLVDTVLPPLAEIFGVLVDTILPPLVTMFQYFAATILPPLAKILGVVVTTLLPPLTSLFQYFVTTVLPPLLQLFGVFVTTLLPPLMQILGVIVQYCLPPLVQLFDVLAKDVLPTLAPLLQLIASEILPPLVGLFKVAAETVLPPLVDLLSTLASSVFPILAQLLAAVAPIIGEVLQYALQLAQDILPVLGDLLSGLANDTIPSLGGSLKDLLGILGDVLKVVIEIVGVVTESITGNQNALQTRIGNWFGTQDTAAEANLYRDKLAEFGLETENIIGGIRKSMEASPDLNNTWMAAMGVSMEDFRKQGKSTADVVAQLAVIARDKGMSLMDIFPTREEGANAAQVFQAEIQAAFDANPVKIAYDATTPDPFGSPSSTGMPTSMTVPTLEVPTLEIPEIEMPELNLDNLEIPNMDEAWIATQDVTNGKLSQAAQDALAAVQAVKEQMGGPLSEIATVFNSNFMSMSNMASTFNSRLNNVISTISRLITKLGKLDAISGVTVSTSVPGNAKGTTDAEDAFIAGEGGKPELVVGQAHAKVFPNSETEKIIDSVEGGAAGERTVNININGSGKIAVPNGDSEAAWDAAKPHIKRVFMEMLDEEVFEEGDGTHDY